MAIALQQASCAADVQRKIVHANVGRVSPRVKAAAAAEVTVKVTSVLYGVARSRWSRRQESNLYLPLRRRPFYPLNYGEGHARGVRAPGV